MIRRLTASATILLTALAGLPAGAQTIGNPELFEKSLEVAVQAFEQYPPYPDKAEARRLADIGYRVAQEANYTKFPFTFHLLDMPEPNAFALPGGHIFVTRGMLELGLTDDMLAALLGHEIAHVVEEHYLHMRRKATLMNILSQAVLVGVLIAAENSSDRQRRTNPYDPRGQDTSRGDLVQGTAAASLLVTELLMRGYSRENESEADQMGQRWATAAGFDPAGGAQLMELMGSRIPQDKKYGYWMTHPFFDERVRGGQAIAKLLKVGEERPADDYRMRTQATLLTYVEQGKPPEKAIPLLKEEALAAWPRGSAAERLRLEKLHDLRATELAELPLSRDYGEVIRAYREQSAEVEELTPESDFLKTLAREAEELEKQRDDLYPRAVKVLEEGVFETDFLVHFLSNFPEAPEVPRAALDLGDSYSRLGNATEAVRLYLRSWEAAPDSPEGQRAGRGLKNLASSLTGLAALQQLALQDQDPELQRLAEERLGKLAGRFEDIANGAEYLRRFSDGPHAAAVGARIDQLAENLYGEVVLYQAVGDHLNAVERINKILTFAPTSPAADRLRERMVLET